MHKTHDTLGRFLPHARPRTREKVDLQDHDIERLTFLYQHGPLPLPYLAAIPRAERHTDYAVSRRLKHLHRAHYISRPNGQFPDQKRTVRDTFLVHDIGEEGLKVIEHDPYVVTPDSWLKHQVMVACITASFALADFEEFMPQHMILRHADRKTMKLDIHGDDLIPDGLFGVKVDGKWTVCFLEADRGTEQLHNTRTMQTHRVTWEGKVDLYETLIGEGLYKDIFQLDAPAVLLNVTTGFSRMKNMMEVRDHHWILHHAIPQFGRRFDPPGILPIREIEWQRNGYKPRKF